MGGGLGANAQAPPPPHSNRHGPCVAPTRRQCNERSCRWLPHPNPPLSWSGGGRFFPWPRIQVEDLSTWVQSGRVNRVRPRPAARWRPSTWSQPLKIARSTEEYYMVLAPRGRLKSSTRSPLCKARNPLEGKLPLMDLHFPAGDLGRIDSTPPCAGTLRASCTPASPWNRLACSHCLIDEIYGGFQPGSLTMSSRTRGPTVTC